MEIIFISKRSPGAYGRVHLGHRATVCLLAVLGLAAGALAYGAFRYGLTAVEPQSGMPATVVTKELERQREAVSHAIRTSQENLDALALRLGEMQARVIRLDALGQRLVETAHLDVGEFDFGHPPGRGGPVRPSSLQPQTVPDFLASLQDLASELDDRETKLKALEGLLMNRKLQAQVHPAGSPVVGGWISSGFGDRTDPISGMREFHEGLDITGRPGSTVRSVAAGVVVFSGVRTGYGNVVEVNHGNGYSTLYAHNRRNLVQVGATVRKGQPLAVMGSTGRSTGRHVHFEVHYDGKPVDPLGYMRAAR